MNVANGAQAQESEDPEIAAHRLASAEMEILRSQFPDWVAAYDDLLPDAVATREEMASMMVAAPTPFALGLMWGKFTSRQEIAAHTGIAFD